MRRLSDHIKASVVKDKGCDPPASVWAWILVLFAALTLVGWLTGSCREPNLMMDDTVGRPPAQDGQE